jgi:hypothetical protein
LNAPALYPWCAGSGKTGFRASFIHRSLKLKKFLTLIEYKPYRQGVDAFHSAKWPVQILQICTGHCQ